MTSLDDAFVARAQREPIKLTIDERELTFRATRASTFGPASYRADLEVVEDGEVIGFITPYAQNQHGVIAERLFDRGAPAIYRDLETGVREQLR